MAIDRGPARPLARRLAASGLVVVVVPALITVFAVAEDPDIIVGDPAPRTVVAQEPIRIVDEDATEAARRVAAESVQPRTVFDDQAQTDTLGDVRLVFAAAREARRAAVPALPDTSPADSPSPPPEPVTPSTEDQLVTLRDRIDFLGEDVLRAVIALDADALARTEDEAVDVARQLARLRISQDELEDVLNEQLRVELALRTLPADAGETIVEPLIRAVLRPTVVVDPDATAAARQRAADEVPEVARTWRAGEPIVRSGSVVDRLELEALRHQGESGADPLITFLKSFAAMALTLAIVSVYLARMQPRVWQDGRRILLLATLTTGYAVLVAATGLLAQAAGLGWWYVVPAGALAILAALLVHPVVGIATMVPAAVIVLLVAPGAAGPVAVFAATAALASVPLVSSVDSRSDLRRASLELVVIYPTVAVVLVGVFGLSGQLGVAVLAGLANALVTGLIVQGALPFLETLFRVPSVTALLDLADRNHPLLRDLEREAPGSYQHSVMVASLVERACREVGANALLGSVAALYHDIGKVHQPHFFIENQVGIDNPHDDLDPAISAVIIQNHVSDGVAMATQHRLPPEVVACIGSHHGTMLVTFFYRQAVEQAGGDPSAVAEDHYRYKGTKPRSREAAILVVADCSEATTRSAAREQGTLSREAIAAMVDSLIDERLEDGQFDDSDLSLRELRIVRDCVVESLVGVYHPRIAYPAAPRREPARTS